MKTSRLAAGLAILAAAWMLYAADPKIDLRNLKTGKDAFANAKDLHPGTYYRITAADLPKPFETPSGTARGGLEPRAPGQLPHAPMGFVVDLYASTNGNSREIRVAPNGDFFVADSYQDRITVYRGRNVQGQAETVSVFAKDLNKPYGIAFYPPGDNPQWVYVGNTGSLVRFPYKAGDLKASGPPETLVTGIPPNGNHNLRDIVFSKDGKRLFLAVGSASNYDEPDHSHPSEYHRANILEYTPEGKFVGVYASGIRNPAGINVNPTTGEVWCSVNERDLLGENLVPDYITGVKEGGFYGWPWYYIGGNPEPRLNGAHPELKDRVIVPDVLIQAHSASLAFAFYDATQFPEKYRGDLFAAEHGSWNRAVRSGYEVVRVPLENGKASGVYEDFLTGFVNPDGRAWGRPVGVAVGHDGALYVTDDGSKSIFRVAYVAYVDK